MFEFLASSFTTAFDKLKGKQKITSQVLKDNLGDIRQALLEADVNYDIVEEFIETISQKCLGEEVLKNIKPQEQIVKIINDELVALMGEAEPLVEGPSLKVIMMVGLHGVGKTSTSAKLAYHLKKQHKKTFLASCDVYRPAAMKQLEVLAESENIAYFHSELDDAVKRAKEAYRQAKEGGFNYLVLDMAGRLQIDDSMMKELSSVSKKVNIDETLLVVDAALGQESVNIAKNFNDQIGITGVVLTKLDGDTRGGAAFSVKKTVDKSIKFITQGEKIEDLEVFRAEGLVSRMLGMGDVVKLVEDMEEHISQQEAEKLEEKIRKSTFDFEDFLSQMEKMTKMGGLVKILSLLPGGNKLKKMMVGKEGEIARFKGMIHSMTIEERRRPKVLNQSRKARIARGSGYKLEEVNNLIKRFDMMRVMMTKMGGTGVNSMMEALENPTVDSNPLAGMQGMMNNMGGGMQNEVNNATKKKQVSRAEKKKKKKNTQKKKKKKK